MSTMPIPNSVIILEVTRVTPSSNSPESAKEMSLELTFFDICWFKFPPVDCVYFYQLSESDSTPSVFSSEILPKLKLSLSHALIHFLPLAGNLKWPSDSPKPIILYTPNDSVSLTFAESNAKNFDILSGHDIYRANELHPLVPELMMSDDIAAILSLQITLFPHQGFSIGMTAHHGLVDGKVATMFVKCWAYLYKNGNNDKANFSLPPELTPDFDRSAVKDSTRLDLLYLNDWIKVTSSESSNERSLKPWQKISVRSVPDEIVRAAFEFTQENIKKLREKVLLKKADGDDAKKQLHLSTFVLTLAYTTTCLIRAKDADANRPVCVVLAADCRARLDPPLSQTYFGNCVISFKSNSNASEFIDGNGFAFAIKMLSDLVEGLKKGILDGAEEKVRGFFASKEPGLQLISVAGSPQLKLYESDFGLGRLKKVEIVSIDRSGAISITESRDGSGGVEVGLTLKKHEMEHFASLFSQGFSSII